jgi:DNA-binding NtrC family response regulator
MAGQYRRAAALHAQAYERNVERGLRNKSAKDLLNIAVPQFFLGQWALAEESLTRARQSFGEIGNHLGIGIACVLQSRISRRKGELEATQALIDKATEFATEASHRRLAVLALEESADLAFESGDPRLALSTLESSLTKATKIAPRGDLVYEIQWRIARACRAIGQIGRAKQAAETSVSLASEASDLRERSSAGVILARIRADLGDATQAIRLLEESILAFQRIEAPFELADAHESMACMILERGLALDQAAPHIYEALRLYMRLGATPSIRRVEELRDRIESEAGLSPRSESASDRNPGVVAVSSAMRAVIDRARELADFDNAVLIEGPTGCGKEIVARTVHASGSWADRPFAPLNCAALSTTLLESELFGHLRGAFTGADRDRIGHLEAAGTGIVFLDELDKSGQEFQVKLLRVLEDRKFVPVGDTTPRPFEARILCASNRDLCALAESREFLPDLYFRLSSVRIEIPALRHRPEDIEALAETYLEQTATRFGSKRLRFHHDARLALMTYPWPGNVRELKNVVEAAAFFARRGKEVTLEHLPREVSVVLEDDGPKMLPSAIEEVERREIELALRKSGGNKTDAAAILGVSRKGLGDRLRRLHMDNW